MGRPVSRNSFESGCQDLFGGPESLQKAQNRPVAKAWYQLELEPRNPAALPVAGNGIIIAAARYRITPVEKMFQPASVRKPPDAFPMSEGWPVRQDNVYGDAGFVK